MSHSRPCAPPASPVFRQAPRGTPRLLPGHVHVWRAMVEPSPACLQVYHDAVSPEERERAQRFIQPERRRRFLAARGILRHILGRYLHTPPRDIRLGAGPHGKPLLHDPAGPPLHFNVSHSRRCAVYAVSRDFAVGIDVEADRDRADYRALARRLCSPDEWRTLQRLPPDQHPAAVLSCWTRKEAVVKAEGTGLAFRLRHLTVSLAPGEPPRLLAMRGRDSAAARWSLMDLPPQPGFHGALAVKGHPTRVLWWEYDPRRDADGRLRGARRTVQTA